MLPDGGLGLVHSAPLARLALGTGRVVNALDLTVASFARFLRGANRSPKTVTIYTDTTRKLIDWLVDNAPEVTCWMTCVPSTSTASPVMFSRAVTATGRPKRLDVKGSSQEVLGERSDPKGGKKLRIP